MVCEKFDVLELFIITCRESPVMEHMVLLGVEFGWRCVSKVRVSELNATRENAWVYCYINEH